VSVPAVLVSASARISPDKTPDLRAFEAAHIPPDKRIDDTMNAEPGA